jgi:hypothetical protein
MLFISDPLPSERHQTLDRQGFDALGTIFAFIFRIYNSFRDGELTSLIHAIFSDEKIAGA